MKMWLGVIEKEIFQIWKLFLCLFCVVEGNFGKRMVEEGEEKRRERWGDFIFQNKLVLKEPGDLFVGCRGEWEEGKEGIHRWRATRVALKKKMEKLLGARQTQVSFVFIYFSDILGVQVEEYVHCVYVCCSYSPINKPFYISNASPINSHI